MRVSSSGIDSCSSRGCSVVVIVEVEDTGELGSGVGRGNVEAVVVK